MKNSKLLAVVMAITMIGGLTGCVIPVRHQLGTVEKRQYRLRRRLRQSLKLPANRRRKAAQEKRVLQI